MKKFQRPAIGMIIAILMSTVLAACGQKGPLRHPDPATQQSQES